MGGREHDDASGHILGLREQHGYDLRCRCIAQCDFMVYSLRTMVKIKMTTDWDQRKDKW